MTLPPRPLSLFALAVGSLVLVACGGNDTGSEEPRDESTVQPVDPAASAFADAIIEGSDGIFTRDEAECYGAALVEEVGADRLVAWGALDETTGTANLDGLPGEENLEFDNAQTRAMSACIGIIDSGNRFRRAMLGAMAETDEDKAKAANDDYWAAITTCMEEQYPEEVLLEAALAEADGGTATIDDAQFEAGWTECEKAAAATL